MSSASSSASRHILVSNALPYANGDIHLGHLVGYIQADIWVRFQRMQQNTVYYVCADDTHGTPVMLRAEKEGMTPEALIERVHAQHKCDFYDFFVEFDNYYTTHSPENHQYSCDIYQHLQQAGFIEVRSVEQLYDPVRQMFLPDRFVKGECPKCGASDQYGDNCEVCGAAYQPMELKNPYSAVSGATPVLRSSDHYFFKLSDPRAVAFLREWTQSGTLPVAAANKMQEWLGAEGENKLSDWDISRDAPYFGFEIPNAPGKYFYVWLDAPVGYLASFANYAAAHQIDTAPYFYETQQPTEMVHFIGKDILYFHALFWPAMLKFSGRRVPTQLMVNGFLTVDGQKMSKSRGTFITARSYLDQKMNPEWLRYYFAAKSSGSIDDVDLNLEDFIARVNADLVGKFINIISRASGFISRGFDGALFDASDSALNQEVLAVRPKIVEAYQERDYARVVREVMALSHQINQLWDGKKPWELAKEDVKKPELQHICSDCILAFRGLSIYLTPILPRLTQAIAQLFGQDRAFVFDDLQQTPARIAKYEHLMTRIEPKSVAALVEANKQNLESTDKPTSTSKKQEKVKENKNKDSKKGEDQEGFISIDDFAKLDLRVGHVLACELVEGSDKLLAFTVDLGEETPRNIFSGIRFAYPDPAALVGRKVIVVANLAPRKMRFGISQGMILSACHTAADGSEELYLLDTDANAKPGSRIS